MRKKDHTIKVNGYLHTGSVEDLRCDLRNGYGYTSVWHDKIRNGLVATFIYPYSWVENEWIEEDEWIRDNFFQFI